MLRTLAILLLCGCEMPPAEAPPSFAPAPDGATPAIAPVFVAEPAPAVADPVPDGPHLIVLGIAQDAGHPQAACTKACCRRELAGEAPGHRVASLGIVDGAHRVLIDATPDLPAQLGRLSPEGRLDGILLTHAHIGHYAGLVNLGREAMGADAVPVYAMPRMKAFLESDRPWSLLSEQGHVALRDLTDGAAVQVTPNVRVTPFEVIHRDEISETVGFRITGPDKTAVYIPDIDKWSRWSTRIEDVVAASDIALLDGTFYGDGEVARDMSEIPHPFVVESAVRFDGLPARDKAKVRFIHLNHTNPLLDANSAQSKAVVAAGFSVAREGERIGL